MDAAAERALILTADQVNNSVRTYSNIPSDSQVREVWRSGAIALDHWDTLLDSSDLKIHVVNICSAPGLSTHNVVTRKVGIGVYLL